MGRADMTAASFAGLCQVDTAATRKASAHRMLVHSMTHEIRPGSRTKMGNWRMEANTLAAKVNVRHRRLNDIRILPRLLAELSRPERV